MEKIRTLDWSIIYYILILVAMIVVNVGLIHHAKNRAEVANQRKIVLQNLLSDLEGIESAVLRGWDIGLRGYAITRTRGMLDPYDYGFVLSKEIITRLKKYGPTANMDLQDIALLEELLITYGQQIRDMKRLLDAGEDEEFRKILATDPGLGVWDDYNSVRRKYHYLFDQDHSSMNSNLAILQNRILFTQGASALLACLLVYLIYRKFNFFAKQKEAYIREVESANEALARHRSNLEKEVNKQTQNLAETNQVLKRTLVDVRTMQSYLLQSEKMTSLGTMTMGMSHEFNNALNQIKGGYQLFQKRIAQGPSQQDPDSESVKEEMKIFLDGVERIERIVKAMQVFAQEGTADFQKTDFNELLEKALVILGPRIDDSISLEMNIPQPFMLRLRQADMLQVILQLLDNALFAAKEAQVEHRGISIEAQRQEGEVDIFFVNTGHPIPEDSLRQIFDPFYTTKEPGVGTGLGLSVCYSVVKAHGGRIEAENLPGSRVSFRLTLPVGEKAAQAQDRALVGVD